MRLINFHACWRLRRLSFVVFLFRLGQLASCRLTCPMLPFFTWVYHYHYQVAGSAIIRYKFERFRHMINAHWQQRFVIILVDENDTTVENVPATTLSFIVMISGTILSCINKCIIVIGLCVSINRTIESRVENVKKGKVSCVKKTSRLHTHFHCKLDTVHWKSRCFTRLFMSYLSCLCLACCVLMCCCAVWRRPGTNTMRAQVIIAVLTLCGRYKSLWASGQTFQYLRLTPFLSMRWYDFILIQLFSCAREYKPIVAFVWIGFIFGPARD